MMQQTLANKQNPVNSFSCPKAPVSIPVNFLTVGQIVRASEIERIQLEENYAACHLESESETVSKFTCADCLCRLIYVGLFKRDSVRSFAVCPECQRAFEF